jgi:hypothetical protein
MCGGILFTAEGCDNKQLDWMQQLQKGLVCNNWSFLSIFGWDWKFEDKSLWTFFSALSVGCFYGMTVQSSPSI